MIASARHLQPELMDQPGIDARDHRQALRGLARVNWISGSAGLLWRPIRRIARAAGGVPLRVLDIASGGGDVAIRLFRLAAARGVQLDITGCDISQTAVDHATKAAEHAGAAVRFERRDALQDPPAEAYDVVTCSLFLHHLTEADAAALLRTMAASAERAVLVNDLARSRLGYALAQIGCRLLSRSPVVHYDGPRSVEGAFTLDEVRRLCDQAGLAGATVGRRWPCRFLMQWDKPP
ncbi:MAG: methyltransferase domain-containing protein, partial [Planctomycetota bacterium]